MTNIFLVSCGVLIGLMSGVVLAQFFWRKNEGARAQIHNDLIRSEATARQQVASLEITQLHLRTERDHFQTLAEERQRELSNFNAKLSVADATNKMLQNQLHEHRNQMDHGLRQMKSEFENLANTVIETKGKTFSEQTEKNVDVMLKPLQEKIHAFQNKIDSDSKERYALKTEIGRLVEVSDRMSKETSSLTETLRGDSKLQGDWGEHVLQNILEAAGLTEGRDFQKQSTHESIDGKDVRPDILINLPNTKHLIIDSKVSLTAYDRYNRAQDDATREQALSEHMISINTHIDDLSAKHYSKAKGINSPDWVFMFVAVEPSYILAMQADENLFYKAQKKNVMLITASTLLASLKTVAYVWQLENQQRNAREIANEASKLYDKFVGFAEDFEKLGKLFDTGQKQYELALGKLSRGTGNVFRRLEVIRELGAAPAKRLKQEMIDASGTPEKNESVALAPIDTPLLNA